MLSLRSLFKLVVKIGIIGYRNHAQRLISLVEENENCELSYVFHPTKEIQHNKFTKNFSNLLDCDAIIIASPNKTHFEYLMKLKDYSGYIFCEKPPVVNFDELKSLEKIEKPQKNRIFFNFNYRFSEFNEILKKNIHSNELGDIIFVELISSQGLAFKNEYMNSWRADGENNKFNLLDTVTIHYLDLIIENFGKSTNQFYFPKLISNNGTSYDTGQLILEYEKLNVSILNSYATPLIMELNIIGTNGQLSLKDNSLVIKTPRDTFDEKNFFISPPIRTKKEIDLKEDYSQSLKKSLEFFINHVLNKKPINEKLFETSLETTNLIFKLRNKKNE